MNFMSKTFKSTTFNRLLVDSMNHTNFIHLYAVVHLSKVSVWNFQTIYIGRFYFLKKLDYRESPL